MDEQNKTEAVHLTSEIVAAYVANNSIPAAEVPALIKSIHQALETLGGAPAPATAVETEPPKPAVPIKKSITDDYLISLFDGRKFKSLKRHLSAEHNMTPHEYRTTFGLPKDYPMVAPSYAKQRSTLAKSLGLGRKAGMEAKPEPSVSTPEAPQRRGRTKAAAE